MNRKQVKALANPSDFVFAVTPGDPDKFDTGVTVYLTPAPYWQQEKCQWDQELQNHPVIRPIAQKLGLFELCESTFEVQQDPEPDAQTMINQLTAEGLVHDPDFQKFIDSH